MTLCPTLIFVPTKKIATLHITSPQPTALSILLQVTGAEDLGESGYVVYDEGVTTFTFTMLGYTTLFPVLRFSFELFDLHGLGSITGGSGPNTKPTEKTISLLGRTGRPQIEKTKGGWLIFEEKIGEQPKPLVFSMKSDQTLVGSLRVGTPPLIDISKVK